MNKARTIAWVSFILTPAFLFSQAPISYETNINEVKICLQGAEIIREKVVDLTPGQHVLIFTGLSPKINPQSVQVTATNDIDVLSVVSKINFLKKQKENANIKALQDSSRLLQTEITETTDLMNAYNIEEEMLKANLKLGGTNNGVQVAEIEKGADFYRKRFQEIYVKRSILNRKKIDLQLKLNETNRQLNELNAGDRYTSEIEMVLKSDKISSTKIRLRYVVTDAGWSPIYDLKATDLDKPINLKYRALAYNNSGVDWENVSVTLSTSDPNASASRPELAPWQLDFNVTSFSKDQGLFNRSNVAQENDVFSGAPTPSGSNGVNIRFETIEISELNTDFKIEEPYNIPSDRKPYSIDVNTFDLQASYKYAAVPKMDKDAFLLAQITGWEELSLIDGPMNVYYGDSYIGMSDIKTRNLGDTLNLSLGRDSKILVTRTKLKEFSKKQFLGTTQRSTYSYKLTVKNNRNQAITIDLEDQVPISTIKEIEVEVEETSKATLFDNTGKLLWKINLQPGESKSYIFTFSVKYPKNKQIKFERTQQRVTPRYF